MEEEGARNAAAFLGLLPSVKDQIQRDAEPSKRLAEPGRLRSSTVEVGLDDDQVQFAVVAGLPSAWTKENDFRVWRNCG